MIDNSSQALDEMFTMLKDAWEQSYLTLEIPIVWGNVAHNIQGAPDLFGNQTPFLHVQALHSSGRTASLRGSRGQKHEKSGTLIAAYRFPEGGGGNADALDVIGIIEEAFMGKRSPNGVWFRNTQTSDVGTDRTWYVMTMTTNFLYDLIR